MATDKKQAGPFVADYEPWRHGGWYNGAAHYPNGACGCVSNHYQLEGGKPGERDPHWFITADSTKTPFATRDAAARAEYVAVEMLKERSAPLVAAMQAVVEELRALTDYHTDDDAYKALELAYKALDSFGVKVAA